MSFNVAGRKQLCMKYSPFENFNSPLAKWLQGLTPDQYILELAGLFCLINFLTIDINMNDLID